VCGKPCSRGAAGRLSTMARACLRVLRGNVARDVLCVIQDTFELPTWQQQLTAVPWLRFRACVLPKIDHAGRKKCRGADSSRESGVPRSPGGAAVLATLTARADRSTAARAPRGRGPNPAPRDHARVQAHPPNVRAKNPDLAGVAGRTGRRARHHEPSGKRSSRRREKGTS
jgi:hypothetical protein